MERYLITILNPATGVFAHYKREGDSIKAFVESKLGGYDNVVSNMVYVDSVSNIEYQECGHTRDNQKHYSILCYNGIEDDIKA